MPPGRQGELLAWLQGHREQLQARPATATGRAPRATRSKAKPAPLLPIRPHNLVLLVISLAMLGTNIYYRGPPRALVGVSWSGSRGALWALPRRVRDHRRPRYALVEDPAYADEPLLRDTQSGQRQGRQPRVQGLESEGAVGGGEGGEGAAGAAEVAPWLLAPRTTALPYAGVTSEETLLRLRAQPATAGRDMAISIFFFSRSYAALAENYVYTLVRFARVSNYVACTYTDEDYAACQDLNLPCWDVSRFLVRPPEDSTLSGADLAAFQSAAVTWLKPLVAGHLLEQGYVVHVSDADVAYSTKPLWESYMRLLEEAKADAAFAEENAAVNVGNFVVLNTAKGRALMRLWAAGAASLVNETTGGQRLDSQQWLQALQKRDRRAVRLCRGVLHCRSFRLTAGNGTAVDPAPLVRTHPHGWTVLGDRTSRQIFGDDDWLCWIAKLQNFKEHPIDPCAWPVLYFHSICVDFTRKVALLKAAGFWLLGDPPAAASEMPRLRPVEHLVEKFLTCKAYPLAFTKAGPAELAKAAEAEAAQEGGAVGAAAKQ